MMKTLSRRSSTADAPDSLMLPPGQALLSTHGLGLKVQDRWLLRHLQLRVQRGECWVILGRNGAGKTQLLNTLAGAQPSAEGHVEVAGKPLSAWPLHELACWRGYAPQRLLDTFSAAVLDVVLQGRHPHVSRWRWEAQSDHALAEAALTRVGMQAFAQRDVTTLSGGERQRVALATLLAQDPPLVLLDEPLAHLDLSQQLRMLALLAEDVRSGRRALMLSIHDLSLASRVATHALLILGDADGTVLAGPVDEVMREDTLSQAFEHTLRRHEADGKTWWLPG